MNARDEKMNSLLTDMETIIRKSGEWHKRNRDEIIEIRKVTRQLHQDHGLEAGDQYFAEAMAALKVEDPDDGIHRMMECPVCAKAKRSESAKRGWETRRANKRRRDAFKTLKRLRRGIYGNRNSQSRRR